MWITLAHREIVKMILDVPYQSQEALENGEIRKWCGLACLWMILSYHLKDNAPKITELSEKNGLSFEQDGFQHKDLLKIAREYGLSGYRKSWWAEPGVGTLIEKFKNEGESNSEIDQWMETNINESLYTLNTLIECKMPVIISVSQDFSPSNSTHLVVLVGVEGNNLIIHDPYKRGASYKISKDEFKNYWLRQAIIIYPGHLG